MQLDLRIRLWKWFECLPYTCPTESSLANPSAISNYLDFVLAPLRKDESGNGGKGRTRSHWIARANEGTCEVDLSWTRHYHWRKMAEGSLAGTSTTKEEAVGAGLMGFQEVVL